jgi:LemA protein
MISLELILLMLLGVAIVIVLFFILVYNALVYKRNNVLNAYSSIDVYLKKRRDLIPNLVNTVKAYMKHERELLENVTRLREQIEKNNDLNQKINLESQLSGTLAVIKARAEAYPELKANQNFLQLQATLTEIEDSIAASRRFYNDAVNDYNTFVQQFPYMIVANMFGFRQMEFFNIPEVERQNVDVKELFNQ